MTKEEFENLSLNEKLREINATLRNNDREREQVDALKSIFNV